MHHIALTAFQNIRDNPLLSIALFSVTYWLVLSRFLGQSRKLKHIPSLANDNTLLSYFGALSYLVNAGEILEASFRKWPGGVFKVPQLTEWLVIVSKPQSIDEIRKAPENVLSAMVAINESLQVEYTLGENVAINQYHIPIVRAQLTRALPQLVPEVVDEVQTAFSEIIPPTEDWTKVKVLDTMMGIVGRASNRIFVGLPLCRDPDYIKLNVQFTIDVVQTGAILHIAPKIFRPIINYLTSNVSKRIKSGLKHLAPVIQARRQECEEKGDGVSKPLDLLTWLMDEAAGEEQTDWNLTSRILTVNFAAIHTSSMGFTHALYYLATYPQYLKPLREEIEEVVKEEGWSKAALDKMVKIDSFIKESQRLNPLSSVMMNRVALNDFTFADGTFVPQGTTVAVAITPAHLNTDVYGPDAGVFDPFRFLKLKAEQTPPVDTPFFAQKKFDMVSTSCDSLAFGHGRHACPGRYFASCELKLMLAHVAMNYDVKMEDEGVRPDDMFVVTARVPNPKAEVLFRKRRAD